MTPNAGKSIGSQSLQDWLRRALFLTYVTVAPTPYHGGTLAFSIGFNGAQNAL